MLINVWGNFSFLCFQLVGNDFYYLVCGCCARGCLSAHVRWKLYISSSTPSNINKLLHILCREISVHWLEACIRILGIIRLTIIVMLPLRMLANLLQKHHNIVSIKAVIQITTNKKQTTIITNKLKKRLIHVFYWLIKWLFDWLIILRVRILFIYCSKILVYSYDTWLISIELIHKSS